MVEIIRENRRPTTVEKLTGAVGQGLKGGSELFQQYQQQAQMAKENEALKEMGLGHLIGLSPELKKIGFTEHLKGQKNKKSTEEQKAAQKTQIFQGLDQTISQMESLVDQPGIGMLGRLNPSDEARFNQGMMQTLKGELLNYYKSLFPRGLTQQEFKKLEEDYLPANWDTVEKMKGKLHGFRDLIKRKLETEGIGEEKEGKKEKVKFNPKNPEHKAKAEQLHKTYKDKEKVREILKREFEGL